MRREGRGWTLGAIGLCGAAGWIFEASLLARRGGFALSDGILLAVPIAFIGVALAVSRRRGQVPATGVWLLAAAASLWLPTVEDPITSQPGGARLVALLGLSQLAPALLQLAATFPSRGAWSARHRLFVPSLAVVLAGAAIAGGTRGGSGLPGLLAAIAVAAGIAFLSVLARASRRRLPAAPPRGELSPALGRLRARILVVALLPSVALGATAFSLPPGALSPRALAAWAGVAGLSIPLGIWAALGRTGRFGIERRARWLLSLALTLAGFALLQGVAVAALRALSGDLDPPAWTFAFPVAALVLAEPLREGLERRLSRTFLRPPHEVAPIVDRAALALGEALDPDRVATILREQIGEALGPSWLEVRLPRTAEGDPAPPVAEPAGVALRAPLLSGEAGTAPGSLLVGPPRSGEAYESEAKRLVEVLALQAGAALGNAAVASSTRKLNARLEERVGERTAELDEAQGRLAHAEKLASLGRLVAGIAHEINNPLNFVQASVPSVGEALDEVEATMGEYYRTLHANAGRLGLSFEDDAAAAGGSPDGSFTSARAALRDIREGAIRVREVVGSLRNFAGQASPSSSPVGLKQVIERARAVLLPRVPSGVIVHPPSGDAPPVRGTALELERVFTNLIANAIDAIGDRGHGQVRLSLHGDGDHVEVLVDDDGPGIPADVRPRLFDPFFTTKPEGKGVGLGLSICDGIVKRSGGTIEALEGPLGGARFRVRLPVQSQAESPLP